MTLQLKQSIAILDVGHGNSTVVIENGSVLVIDAGPKNALLEFLREQKITHIDLLIISHADQDHLGALAQLMASNEFTLGNIILNSDADKKTAVWDDVLYELDKAACRKEIYFDVGLVPKDAPIFKTENVSAEVLGPSRYLAGKGPGGEYRDGRKITTNSISAVIRLKIAEKQSVLLPGDIDIVGLDDLLEHYERIESPILVFPHHGGKQGATNIEEYIEKICKAVNPQVIIFSIGRGIHDTPNQNVIKIMREKYPYVRIMCTQLSKHCSDLLPDKKEDCLNDVFCYGREFGKCCAGTILINIDDRDNVLPSKESHYLFLEKKVEKPLCIKN
jgi:beta-lactamase superfamily II metal-dependent hydrolase